MDKTKQRIQELCPDVMELKFGCEVEYMPKQHKGVYLGLGADPIVVAFPWGVQTEELKFFKILGSPITLAVVLRAIGKSTPKLNIIMNKGRIFIPKKNIGAHLAWNLEHDNYDEQSEECKKFIGSLLGV